MTDTSASQSALAPQTQLKRNAFGVPSILFFVLSAQAPLTSIVGAAGVAVALGNGPGLPGAYLVVGLVIVVFSVGFTTMTRHVDSRGGFYALIRTGLGERIGTGGTLVALLSYSAVQLAMYGLMGASLGNLLERHFGFASPWWLWVLVAVALVWALGSRQVELGAKLLAALVGLEIAILAAFAVVLVATRGIGSFDVAASFSPSAIMAGAPGVAVMFAIACMFGFESTAIYSAEARDPRRTVPRATYIAVITIAVFLAGTSWAVVSYYGAANAQGAAFEALGTDAALFALNPINDVLGGWAGTAADVLLVTSLFAGVLAFHNMITRYFHALAGRRLLPAALERTNRHHAPAHASLTQSVVAATLVVLMAVVGLDPVADVFSWFSGLAVAALVVLYLLTSAAVVAFFRRDRVEDNPLTTLVAPVASVVLMAVVLAMVVRNFGVLTGGSTLTVALLLGAVPVAFVLGVVGSRRAVAPRS